jgi:tetratricopeptide (TPR) repeat protein
MKLMLLLGVLFVGGAVLLVQQFMSGPSAAREDPFAADLYVMPASGDTAVRSDSRSGAAQPHSLSDSGAVLAQAEGDEPERPAAPAQAAPVVDETALRYFAARGDTARLEAEIARLRALYPNWTPPENPLEVPPQGDPQLDEMWRLYSEGKVAEVRKAISDRQSREPDWQVPADLLERLALAEARERLINASDIKQYDTVIRVASANPAMLTCGDVDVLWRVAEAFAQTDRRQRAVDAYLYILRNCEKPEERLATVQKAMDQLPASELDLLLATERTVDGRPEFESLRGEIARRAIIAADADPKIVVPPADLALVEKLADDGGPTSDDLLLGWYHLRRDDPAMAEARFRKALAKENDAAAAQGLALALINQDKPREAEEILYPFRDASDEVRAVYLAAVANMLALQPPPQFAPEVLQRVVAAVAEAKDAASAQQLGWYADGFNQFETAERWFRTALQWNPDDEPSAYGLALMRWKLGNRAGVREVQEVWAGLSDRIRTVGQPNSDQSGQVARKRSQVEVGTADDPTLPRPIRTTSVDADPPPLSVVPAAPPAAAPSEPPQAPAVRRQPAARQPQAEVVYEAEQPRAAPSRQAAPKGGRVRSSGCRTTEDPTGLSPEAALARGWCLMDVNRPIEAARAFEVALRGNGQTRADAAYGQSLAYMRAGLTDMAAVAATKAPFNASRSVEVNAALLAARANSAYQNGRYVETLLALDERARIVPEQTDLMVLRGYAYLNLVRYADAERVFRAAAATGNRDAMRGLNDLWAARNPQSSPY